MLSKWSKQALSIKAIVHAAMLLLILILFSAAAAATDLPGSQQEVMPKWQQAWMKTATKTPKYLNRLVLSESAYLRQHADNPIDWYPWEGSIFKQAINENKLIFLSIGYASCHWCHVMESESFADVEVATNLNHSYVSIKVDREQRPDIDAYYTRVVETIKGESGWPMTVILTPDLKPIFAANYLNKKKLLTVLSRLSKLWLESPEVLNTNAQFFQSEIERKSYRSSKTTIKQLASLRSQAKNRLLENIDKIYGGFGQAQKFPDEIKLQFLLNLYKLDPDITLRQTLVSQLNTIMRSGLGDVVFGGIFRYTTNPEMTRPHFEKMLYNQALMVSLFADAASWLEQPAYKEYAESIINFVENYMRLPTGGFAAAVDADHGGKEGAYYYWPESVLVDLPLGLSTVAITDDDFYIYGILEDIKSNDLVLHLKQSRTSMPRRIDNQLTAWNALWISALLQAGKATQAAGLATVIWEGSWANSRLMRMGSQPGFLDDYAYLSRALWQLYLQTGTASWKERARILDTAILNNFYTGGRLSYRSKAMQGEYAVDLNLDTELPAVVAVVLGSFKYHLTDAKFIQAYDSIRESAIEDIGGRPEYYLSLIQHGLNPAKREQIIAMGNGSISLHPGAAAGEWQLQLRLDPDWHVNATTVLEKSLIPLQIQSDNSKFIKVDAPIGNLLEMEFSDTPLNIYSELTKINITAETPEKQLTLRVKLQACSNNLCLLPEELLLKAVR